MISHLIGILEHIEGNVVIIDVNGIGYNVNVPISILPKLPKRGERLKIFTYQLVREDAISLYGFLTKEERSLFSLLLTVNGIGPKGGLSLISGIPIDKLVTAITKGNVDLLVTVPGIGKKTAQRLIIELREKIAKAYALEGGVPGIPEEEPSLKDAISALMALGYTTREAREAIKSSGIDLTEGMSVEEIIKRSLKTLH